MSQGCRSIAGKDMKCRGARLCALPDAVALKIAFVLFALSLSNGACQRAYPARPIPPLGAIEICLSKFHS